MTFSFEPLVPIANPCLSYSNVVFVTGGHIDGGYVNVSIAFLNYLNFSAEKFERDLVMFFVRENC